MITSTAQDDVDDQSEQIPQRKIDRNAEHALVARLRSGDPESIAMAMSQYASRLLRFAFHIVGMRDVAEDVVQDVFVQLWNRRTALDPESHLQAYLFHLVRNRALMERRSMLVRDRYAANFQAEAAVGTVSSLVQDPEDDILTTTTINSAMEKLSERRRLAVRLRLGEAMTHAEIAEVLQVSPEAAQRLVARALADLRKIIWGV